MHVTFEARQASNTEIDSPHLFLLPTITSNVMENAGWSVSSPSQVPKTSVNLDGDVREKFMCPSSILTQGSWEWRVSQISTSRILHSGLNFR